MWVSEMTAISTHRMMVIVKDWGGLVSMPPLAIPPLSTARTVTVADPRASSPWLKVSVPFGRTCGWTVNRPGLSLVTLNVTDWPASAGGPGEMPVAQPGTV